MGKELVSHLATVENNCKHHKYKEICIASNKPSAEMHVNNLQDIINKFEKLATETSDTLLSKVEECTSNEINKLKEKSSAIKSEADGCISYF